jgi:hypothetical protein
MITNPEWNELNTLLSHLKSFNVVKMVEQHYIQFGNTAPASLLKDQIDVLEKLLEGNRVHRDPI